MCLFFVGMSGFLPAGAQVGPQVGAQAPSVGAGSDPGSPAVRRSEAPVAGFVRKDNDSLAFALAGSAGSPARDLFLHHFDFNGDPVPTSKLHLRELGPGVVEVTSVAYSVGEWQFSLSDRADYYGFGERFNTLNHARTTVRNASVDNAYAKGGSSYKPAPFWMSTTGYGVWVDTTADATFDMNATSSTDVIVTVPAEKLRVVLFRGPEFPKILEQFTGLTQRAIVPPYWAFAPWMGRDFYKDDAEVREDVDRGRELGLPASVILIDSPWETSCNSYKFNPKQFSDAPAMVKHLHEAGYKLVLWHTPWINTQTDPPGEPGFAGKIAPHSEIYDEAAQHGFFVKRPDGTPYVGRWWKGLGSLIDFTNVQAKAWWQNQVRQAIRAGADGFKDDDAEGNFLGDVTFADGTSKELMRNRYALLYQNAVEELIAKDLKGNGVVLARSTTTGANGLGFLWAGDNESSFSRENGLPTVVTAGLNAGMSGMPLWTADLGGYIAMPGGPDPRLLMRWTEFAAFSPTMELLSQTNLPPWKWDAATGGTRALDLYRKYAVLHMSLFPYRYAAAQESARTGMPILRALPLLYQNDAKARVAPAEYMFGPDFLVAPVVDEGTQRPVYLPVGRWIDLWTGVETSGGQTLVVDAPMDLAPVFVRSGAVIPKIPEDVMTLVPASEIGNTGVKSMDQRRVYEVFGNSGADGTTTITDFEGRKLERKGNVLKISGDPAPVTVRLRFSRAGRVTVNGASMRLDSRGDTRSVEFDHAGTSTVAWE